MSTPSFPQQVALKIVHAISPSAAAKLREFSEQPLRTQELTSRVERLERELQDAHGKLETLNRDLDESRRLNLRAAELMDVAFSKLAG